MGGCHNEERGREGVIGDWGQCMGGGLDAVMGREGI